MTSDEALIDRIVRDVLEQLQARPGAERAENGRASGQNGERHGLAGGALSNRSRNAQASGGREPPVRTARADLADSGGSRPPLAGSESATVLLEENVITRELLAGRLNGRPRVRIGPHSILTPSARDFLREHGVEWDRNSEAAADPTAATTWKAIVVEGASAISEALDDAGRSAGVRWTQELAGDAAEAVRSAISSLCRADSAGVVVFTSQAAAVACRANRNERVRAAVVSHPKEIESLKQQMGPNLFCVDPEGRSYFELRNLLRAIAAGCPPQVPADWSG